MEKRKKVGEIQMLETWKWDKCHVLQGNNSFRRGNEALLVRQKEKRRKNRHSFGEEKKNGTVKKAQF